MINLITPMYLAGFLESDGTFRAAFSNKQLKVEVRFAQKSNPNLLPPIANYLEKHEILSFLMRNHLELKRILQIFEEDFQLIGELRTKQLALIRKFFELQTNNQLNSYESASNFVNEIYEVAKLSTKGRRRKYSCEQALELVHKYTTENEFKS